MTDSFLVEPTKGEDAGRFWLGTLDDTIRYRRNHWNGIDEWNRNIRLYRGKHWNITQKDAGDLSSENPNDLVTVNLTGSTIRRFLPFYVRRDPQFMLTPERQENIEQIKTEEAYLNQIWRRNRMKLPLRRSVLDSMIIGHAVVKTGFKFNEEWGGDNSEKNLEYDARIRKGMPYIRRIDPRNFLFDVEGVDADLNTARWCAEIIYRPLQDVLDDKNYDSRTKNMISRNEVSPQTQRSFLSEGDTAGFYEEDMTSDSLIVLFEIWDKRSGKYYVLANGVDRPLREESRWPYDYLLDQGLFPYCFLPFVPINDEPYPVGLPKLVYDQQLELNRIRTAMFQHRRITNRKYLAIKDRIDEDEAEKIAMGEDGVIGWANQPGAFDVVKDAPISQDEYQMESVCKQDFREVTGSDELLRGGNLPSRTTATEIGARSRLQGLIMEDHEEQVDNYVESIGAQLIYHARANLEAADVAVVVGSYKARNWVPYDPTQWAGGFEVSITSTSAPKTDPELERQQAIQVMQIMTQNMQVMQQAGIDVNWQELFAWVFSQFEGQDDIKKFFPGLDYPSPEGVPESPEPASQQPGSPSPPNLPNMNRGGPQVAGARAGSGGTNSQILGAANGPRGGIR